MATLRRMLETIRVGAAGLTGSQKLLIGSLVTVLLMTLFVVRQYAGTPDMTPLLGEGYAAEDQQKAARWLDGQGLVYDTRGDGVVMVSATQQRRLLATMSQTPGALPDDTTLLFDSIIDKQSWTKSDGQNRQLYTIALQNELANTLAGWAGIDRATVIIDSPPKRQLNRPDAAPTAAVSVFSEGGLSQDAVDAIASFVAGSRSGLTPERVRITDGTTGRQHRARREDDFAAGDAQELTAAIERRKQQQIHEMLAAYIPGVIVTVHAQVDARRVQTQRTAALPEGQGSITLVTGEQAMELVTSEPLNGAEPGVRSNTGADISGAGGGVATSSQTESDTTFEPVPGRETTSTDDPRGFPTKINAVVNVPRPYFVGIWQAREARRGAAAEGQVAEGEAGANAADPTDEQIQEIIAGELSRITADVEGLIDTTASADGVRGEARVSMIPVAAEIGFGAGGSATGLGVLGLGGIAGGPIALGELVKTVALGGMAVLALGLVVMTALKTNKREDLPSAHELVGVPPALDHDEEIVGEADASDAALSGIELSDDEMKDRKMLEQVADMVDDRPEEAARLIGRWMQMGDR